MPSSHTVSHARAIELIESLWRSERRGAFESGLLEVSPDWADPGFDLNVNELPQRTALELSLRFASLLGYQGHYKKIKDSQLRARDILTGVLRGFESLRDEEKCAECENHLALTYWRTGEFAEARAWLAAAYSRDIPATHIHRLATVAYEMLVNVGEQDYPTIVRLFERYESVVRGWADDWIGGSFYINAGIGFMESGRPEDALLCYELAVYRAERSGMQMQLASVENERAHVYASLNRFAKAHLAVDRGIEIFRSIGDTAREGMSMDTKAGLYLAEGRLDEALVTIEAALAVLGGGENKGFLAEAFVTEAKILLWMDNFNAAIFALTEGINIARNFSGHQFANNLIAQFQKEFESRAGGTGLRYQGTHEIASNDLELSLPASLAEFSKFRGIRINNTHLSCVGVEPGDLVIAAEAAVSAGDLVAASEVETGEIHCGFYDNAFGMVCLEGCDGQPLLFDEAGVKVLGKIVGVVRGKDDAGRSLVEPIGDRSSLPEV